MPNVVRIMTVGRYDHMIASPHLALCFVVCTLSVNESFFLNVGDVYAVAMASNLFLQRRAASSRFPHILDLFVPIEVETRALRLFPASPRVHFVPRRCRLHGATESRDVESFGNAGRVSQQIQNGLCCFLTNNSSIHQSLHPFSLSIQRLQRGLMPFFFNQVLCESSLLLVRLQCSLMNPLTLRAVLHRCEALLVVHALPLNSSLSSLTLQRRQIFVVSNWNGKIAGSFPQISQINPFALQSYNGTATLAFLPHNLA